MKADNNTTMKRLTSNKMQPQEKAKQILNKFWNKFDLFNEEAKECALVLVDELISETGSAYWYKVKKELGGL